jgi:predicted DCC family thiol-disulfide oxidoreductase YuxK
MKSFQPFREDTNSVVYLDKDKQYIKSEAFFRIINQMGGNFRLLLFFRVFPKKLTDWVYDVIARNRYNWFGKNDTCKI